MGAVYYKLEYYERALEGKERLMGKAHPSTFDTVMNTAVIYEAQKDYGKAEELYERVLEGYEAQFGKDHKDTKICAKNFRNLSQDER
ncbi:hypothetical protein TrLO_g1626 [Triparma laevis f. longispina]|nr:hypothetical protein TrLO_g1626 [Triparma laevis f. longispina]